MTVWTFTFTETVRLLFNGLGLAQHQRYLNRVISMANGIAERLLFSILALVAFWPDADHHPRAETVAMLGTAMAAYIGVQALGRNFRTTQKTAYNVSIHAIWGSMFSLSLAAFAGCFFWHVTAGYVAK